ncbi:MAG: hypothetical protein K0R76_1129 [Alphaproteobacteria bacterium]|jgi:hypothetical protein|nr:hypothetical protein [Alphaproteobacteria bacterium]
MGSRIPVVVFFATTERKRGELWQKMPQFKLLHFLQQFKKKGDTK